jgi:hypothetical protein
VRLDRPCSLLAAFQQGNSMELSSLPCLPAMASQQDGQYTAMGLARSELRCLGFNILLFGKQTRRVRGATGEVPLADSCRSGTRLPDSRCPLSPGSLAVPALDTIFNDRCLGTLPGGYLPGSVRGFSSTFQGWKGLLSHLLKGKASCWINGMLRCAFGRSMVVVSGVGPSGALT